MIADAPYLVRATKPPTTAGRGAYDDGLARSLRWWQACPGEVTTETVARRPAEDHRWGGRSRRRDRPAGPPASATAGTAVGPDADRAARGDLPGATRRRVAETSIPAAAPGSSRRSGHLGRQLAVTDLDRTPQGHSAQRVGDVVELRPAVGAACPSRRRRSRGPPHPGGERPAGLPDGLVHAAASPAPRAWWPAGCTGRLPSLLVLLGAQETPNGSASTVRDDTHRRFPGFWGVGLVIARSLWGRERKSSRGAVRVAMLPSHRAHAVRRLSRQDPRGGSCQHAGTEASCRRAAHRR